MTPNQLSLYSMVYLSDDMTRVTQPNL